MALLRQLVIVLGIVCPLSLILSAQSPDSSSTVEQRIQRIQDRILSPPILVGKADGPSLAERMAADRVPGVSIAVINDGEIEWARGFGVDRTGGLPVTAETLFQAGSISKPVTALAVLRLVEADKLSLDDDVNHLRLRYGGGQQARQEREKQSSPHRDPFALTTAFCYLD